MTIDMYGYCQIQDENQFFTVDWKDKFNQEIQELDVEQQEFIHSYVELIQNAQPVEFKNLSPRPQKLLESLNQCINDQLASEWIQQIEGSIEKFVLSQIEEIQQILEEDCQIKAVQKQLIDLQKQIGFASQKVQQNLMQQFDQIKSFIEEKIEEDRANVQVLSSIKKIDQFKTHQLIKSSKYDTNANVLAWINQQYQALCIEGLKLLENGDLIKVMEQIVPELEKFQEGKFEVMLDLDSNDYKLRMVEEIEQSLIGIFQTVASDIVQEEEENSQSGFSEEEEELDDQTSENLSVNSQLKNLLTRNQFNNTGLSGQNLKANLEYILKFENIQKFNTLFGHTHVEQHIDLFIKHCFETINQIETKYNQALDNQEISELVQIIQNCQSIQKTFNNLKKAGFVKTLKSYENREWHEFSEVIRNDKFFVKQILSNIKNIVTCRLENLNKLLELVDFKKDQKQIEEQFRLTNEVYQELNQLSQMSKEIKEICQIDLKLQLTTIENNFNACLDLLADDLIKNASRFGKTITNEQTKDFNIYYKNFLGIKNHLSFGNGKLMQKIEKISFSIDKSIQDLYDKAKRDPDHKNVSEILIHLQNISELIEVEDIQEKAKNCCNDILNDFKRQNNKNTSNAISQLYSRLAENVAGSAIVSSNDIFKGAERFRWNTKFAEPSLEITLNGMKGDYVDISQLRDSYQQYHKLYEKTVDQFLQVRRQNQNKPPNFDVLVDQVYSYSKPDLQNWTENQIKKLPELLASIFALQTCLNDESYMECDKTMTNESDRKMYLWQPRIAQVLGIFRSLGIGYSQWNFTQNPINFFKNKIFHSKESAIKDNFVQIKTGEGKSVTLAAVSIIFALHGFEAHCGCYSSYLSQRDYNAFLPLFNQLGLTKLIKYGEFNSLCEGILNQQGDIRSAYLQAILSDDYNYLDQFKEESLREQRKCVLIIDEVDVFFGNDFYGQVYNPRADISCDEISNLTDLIWQNRGESSPLELRNIIEDSEEYEYAKLIFKGEFEFILDEAINKMIATLIHIDKHIYECQHGKIGYKTIDSVDYDEKRDYFTMWAYYLKNEEGSVYAEHFQNSKSIIVICGQFSFSQIPFLYHLMVGVSGTLQTLTKSEQYIVKNIYNIQNMTFLPSIFSASNFTMVPTIIEKQGFYYNKLVEEITRSLRSNKQSEQQRAVLVFFKNIKELQAFEDSQEFKIMRLQSQKIIETSTNGEKESRVSQSSRQGVITLCTRIFGRGTDFICRDQAVNDNGGVAVIQTFYSHTESEEIQIKGRTARQGTQGSYQKLLLENDLSEFNVTPEEIASWNRFEYDAKLVEKRNLKLEQKQGMDTNNLEQLKIEHQKSLDNLAKVIQGRIDKDVIEFLKSMNSGPDFRESSEIVRTLVLFDATGSMGGMFTNTKNSIKKMYDQAKDVLKTHKISQSQFEIQLACYRNYSSGPMEILEHSDWAQDSLVLSQFLSTTEVSGGQGNEAIEIGLQYGNQLADDQKQPLTQIFLIGDAPPNTKDEVKVRKGHCRNIWQNQFKNDIYYKDELALLIKKNIPIYSFYVENSKPTIAAFTEIATSTKGTCKFLDVNNIQTGQTLLIESFVQQILARVAVAVGKNPQDLLQTYQKSYGRK